jgi:Mrp family chromosome partitioning ATPase
MDGVILVVRSGHTRRGPLQRSKEILGGTGANLLGAVLNQTPRRERDYAYYYAQDGQSRRRNWFANPFKRSHKKKKSAVTTVDLPLTTPHVVQKEQHSKS